MSGYEKHYIGPFFYVHGWGVKAGRWQGTYVYWDPSYTPRALSHPLIARLYVDPRGNTTCNRWANPTLHIGLTLGWWRRESDKRCFPKLRSLKIPLPYLRWKHPESSIRGALWKVSSRFWHWVEYGPAASI